MNKTRKKQGKMNTTTKQDNYDNTRAQPLRIGFSPVHLRVDTIEALRQYKARNKYKSYNEAINKLLEKNNDVQETPNTTKN